MTFGHWVDLLGRFGHWNYFLLALGVLVEGPVVTLTGATLASAGVMNPWGVFVVASLSNMTADSLWYSLGRFSGQKRLKWLLRKVGVRAALVDRLAARVKAHSRSLIFMAKITLSFAIPALVAAGMAEVPWGETLLALFPAEMLWTGLLVAAGYLFGHIALQMTQGFKVLGLAGGVLFLLFLARYFVGHSWHPTGNESL